MELSKRLHMVASMVEKGSIPADVGCDHGYVAIYLIQNGISPHVFAMDVNEGPLERAREHVEEYGLAAYIDVRLSDGLSGRSLPRGKAGSGYAAGSGNGRQADGENTGGRRREAGRDALGHSSASVRALAGEKIFKKFRIFHYR